MRSGLSLLLTGFLVACGSGGGGSSWDDVDGGASGDGSPSGGDASGSSAPKFAELWYSVDDLLVYIELDAASGSVVGITTSSMNAGTDLGQNAITMLDDGSLVGSRLSQADDKTHFYSIAEPPRDGSPASVVDLGVMPDDLMLEGLYTDCDGRLYGMDTGEDDTNAVGNRLLRFTGDYLAGDFGYVVVSDLATADVADIDDMGPGIDGNEITDNPGLAIDSGDVYEFNFETGTGSLAGAGGSWGIHALGDTLFDDGRARLYLLSSDAELFEMDPDDYSISEPLATGPTDVEGNFVGWSSLAGPLTDCDSGFVID